MGSVLPTYDARGITKLVANYRSHTTLLALPNKLFYAGDLVSRADPVLVEVHLHYMQATICQYAYKFV